MPSSTGAGPSVGAGVARRGRGGGEKGNRGCVNHQLGSTGKQNMALRIQDKHQLVR
jgi:hypothetical protein